LGRFRRRRFGQESLGLFRGNLRPRAAALKVGIRLEPGQRFGFHNFRHSLATFLVNRGKDVKTIQGLLCHAKVTTTLDLYSQSIDAAKLEAQEDIALAIKSTAAAE
jgi:integrase